MKSRCLLNSFNSTIVYLHFVPLFFFFSFFFNQIKHFLFLPWVNLYMITGIYLHDPPPFNGPFFMTPPFSESQKVVTLPLFPPPLPPANFWQVPNKTNYTRTHKFIYHKNNCCQVFSRNRNDQPMFVNECKFEEGWQSSSLKNMFSGFRRAKRKHIFSKSKPYSTTSYEHMNILTLGEL